MGLVSFGEANEGDQSIVFKLLKSGVGAGGRLPMKWVRLSRHKVKAQSTFFCFMFT